MLGKNQNRTRSVLGQRYVSVGLTRDISWKLTRFRFKLYAKPYSDSGRLISKGFWEPQISRKEGLSKRIARRTTYFCNNRYYSILVSKQCFCVSTHSEPCSTSDWARACWELPPKAWRHSPHSQLSTSMHHCPEPGVPTFVPAWRAMQQPWSAKLSCCTGWRWGKATSWPSQAPTRVPVDSSGQNHSQMTWGMLKSVFSHPVVDLDKQISKVTLTPQVDAEKLRRLAGKCRHCGLEPLQSTSLSVYGARSAIGCPKTTANWGDFFVGKIQSITCIRSHHVCAQISGKFSYNYSHRFSHQLSLKLSRKNNSATNISVCHPLAEPCSESHSCQPWAEPVIGQHCSWLLSAAALMNMAAALLY